MHTLYGSSISYYAGKLEAYLRYRGEAYELLPHAPHADEIIAGAGSEALVVASTPLVRGGG